MIRIITAIFFWALLVVACQPAGEQTASEYEPESGIEMEPEQKSTLGMLQHTVFFYLNEDVTPEEADEFEQALIDLLGIESIYKGEMGPPAATVERDVTDHSFAFAIYTWFETMEDYEAYDVHPDHLEFIEENEHLWADVKVYDVEITGENP